MIEFKPIKSAPMDGTYILVTNIEAGTSWIACYCPAYRSGYRPSNPWASMMLNHKHFTNKRASTFPTHWAPLPGLPEAGE